MSVIDEQERHVTNRSDGASLVCSIGTCFCAIAIEHVVETMRPLPIEPIAGASDLVSGVAIVRGVPIPVVDAGRLLGVDRLPAAMAQPGGARFVTVRAGERRVAFAVETVLGVRHLSASSLRDLPPLLRDSVDSVSKIGALDAQLLVVLRAMRLVPEAVWRSLDAKGESQ